MKDSGKMRSFSSSTREHRCCPTHVSFVPLAVVLLCGVATITWGQCIEYHFKIDTKFFYTHDNFADSLDKCNRLRQARLDTLQGQKAYAENRYKELAKQWEVVAGEHYELTTKGIEAHTKAKEDAFQLMDHAHRELQNFEDDLMGIGKCECGREAPHRTPEPPAEPGESASRPAASEQRQSKQDEDDQQKQADTEQQQEDDGELAAQRKAKEEAEKQQVEELRAVVARAQLEQLRALQARAARNAKMQQEQDSMLAAMVDPAGDAAAARPADTRAPEIRNGAVPAPSSQLGRSSELEDIAPDRKEADETRTLMFGWARSGAESVKTTVEKHIEAARRSLPATKFRRYEKNAKDAEAISSGTAKALGALDVGFSVNAVANADPGKNRQYHIGETIYKYGGELVQRVVKKGFTETVAELFPRAAPYILEAASTVTTVGDVLLDSDQTTDFHDVIRDNTGRYSLADKQHALSVLVKTYDETGSRWKSQDIEQLVDEMRIVLDQADELRQQKQARRP